MSTPLERLSKMFPEHVNYLDDAQIIAFSGSEVRLALEPSEAAPELAQVMRWALGVLADPSLIGFTGACEVLGAIRVMAAELDRLRAELLRKDKVVGRAIDALQAVNLCGACEMQWVKALEMFHTSKPAPPAEREPNCEG